MLVGQVDATIADILGKRISWDIGIWEIRVPTYQPLTTEDYEVEWESMKI